MAGSRVKGQGSSPDVALLLHIGIHAGDVIREANNVYGGAVNIASRVASEAAAGETLVSATVRDLARTSAGVSFEDRGERELKGVGEPVRVFAVREA
jgi:class 3 adenylate cyclase